MNNNNALSYRALFLLWLAGNGLRLTILAVPPILALIIQDLKLSGTEVGILNGIPVLLFALASVPGSLLIARVGAVPALIIGLIIAGIGSALRGAAFNSLALYATTAVMSVGIALMQPALPPTVRQWVPQKIGFSTAVYTNGLLVGEIIPVVLAVPLILPLLSGSWRASLVFWSAPLFLIAAAIFLWQPKSRSGEIKPARRWMPDWRDPLLWKMGFVMGGANQLYFCANAFLPGFLLSTDRTELIAPALSGLNAGQLPVSLLLLMMASRWERAKWPVITTGVLALIGILGIVTASGLLGMTAAASLIGFACAGLLTLVLALPALLVAPDDVPRVSAGMFTIGYSIAMVISIVAGAAWDITGNAAYAFLPMAVAVLPIILLPPSIDFSRRRL
jgi:CP family cyanate transporter-like MFS transporter